MSYIIKKKEALINLKITNAGRRSLANGTLVFSQFGLGDSEVDYLTYDSSTSSILRPVDNNSDIMYQIPNRGDNNLVQITNLTALPHEVHQSAIERGFYTKVDNVSVLDNSLTSGAVFQLTNVAGDTGDFIYYPDSQQIAPQVGQFIVIKTPYAEANSSEYVYDFEDEALKFNKADTVLIFQVKEVVEIITDGFTLKLDRDLPKNPHFTESTCVIYEGPKFIENYLDEPNPISYWSDDVLNFDLNGVIPNDDSIPIWNFNLVLIQDMIGMDSTIDRNNSQVNSKAVLASSILFKYYDDINYDKIGIIHYTNNTISNWYGEGFYRGTFKLDIPHVMWHKKKFSGPGTGTGIGYTFICGPTQKLLGGKIRYYDLIDQETEPTVVGKVLIDYKLCVIDHPELLMALSIKGNRNWTLPKPKLSKTEPGTCSNSNSIGALLEGESLHVTYIMYDSNGVTPVHCDDYTTITSEFGGDVAKDVIFELSKDELAYLKSYSDASGTGFKVNHISLLWQKTEIGERPSPNGWKIKEITNYLGSNGCLSFNCDELVKYSETLNGFVAAYPLAQPNKGEMIVISNGSYKATAVSEATVSPSTPYYYDGSTNIIHFHASLATPILLIYNIEPTIGNIQTPLLSADNINNLRVFIDKDMLDNSQFTSYNLRDYIKIADINSDDLSFGDEEFFMGNITTDIKATIYKSLITCNVLPNQFVTSTNPTWNSNQDIVQFSELGLYDSENNLVAIGKFSQPLKRKYNSDVMVIQATIDF